MYFWVLAGMWFLLNQALVLAVSAEDVRILELQGRVEFAPDNSTRWQPAQSGQMLRPLDHLRTGENSRVALRWSDQSIVPFGASTELEILPPENRGDQCGLQLVHGIISFFHRDQPGHIRVVTHGAVAGVEGTEFLLASDDAGDSTLSVVDGKVKFSNEHGGLELTNGEQAAVEAGKSPARTAGFIANNLLQWCFYYPAVIEPDELPLTADEQNALAGSLAAYRSGDLLAALAKYPADRKNISDGEKVFHAALLLSVGEVENAGSILASIPGGSERAQKLAGALHQLVAAVKRQPFAGGEPQLASELLAASYFEQSRSVRETSLQNALKLAQQAAAAAPKSGFAWERVAELQFSFGRTKEASEALEKSLVFAPRNAQAQALKGFLLAAANDPRAAREWFDRAIAADAALGNAWLGRGLVRIHLGDNAGGREDLLVAAALEPQRAELRSYLGKAYANSGDDAHAVKELSLAKKLDPNDPTAWLYSALLNQQDNRINDAIRDLEKSQSLNDNRSVYRSQLLLDQDHAVRSASLASVYQDAGMTDWSVNEAGRAVNYDYANYSAHLFLGDSYSNLRDPNLINNRYETPAVTEYFIANLLAPADAGVLSPAITQEEYSKLFDQNHVGVISDSQYLSRGAWSESGVLYGVYDNFSYSFESDYTGDRGQRANNEIDNCFYDLSLKYQLSPKDTLWGSVSWSDIHAADTAQSYYNYSNPDFHFHQFQDQNVPTAEIGLHHEWSPGVHTLFLAARIEASLSLTNYNESTYLYGFNGSPDDGVLNGEAVLPIPTIYSGEESVYSGELQQIWEGAKHTTIIGTRVQYGHFTTFAEQDGFDSIPWGPFVFEWEDYPYEYPSADTNAVSLFKRFNAYAYHQWQVFEPLELIGGITYDHITYPENFLDAPISSADQTAERFSPKAGLIWTPLPDSTVRFAYTRSIAGANVDQSYQLEPAQVAGFVQSFRSIIPESVAGGNPGAEFETYDLSVEQKFHTGTYLAASAELLNSTSHRTDGAYFYYPDVEDYPEASPGVPEHLAYQERSLQLVVNQLVGRDWAFGARYRLSDSVLKDDFIGAVPPPYLSPIAFEPHQRTEGVLQQLDLTALYNHPGGFFAKGEALFSDQSNHGYSPAEPGQDFWQFNAYAGWRFLHRHAEFSLGLLNIGDQDYQLNPLNFYNELPHARTLLARLRLNF